MRKYILPTLLIVLALAVLTACSSPADKPVTQIRLPMGYIPNVQFSPFYVALEKGYFADEGIELEFDYSFETDGMKLVAAGELPFTLASGEQVPLARAQGLPVVYVLQWWQEFPVVVVSLAENNIQQPADLNGKSVGTPIFGGASYIGWEALVDAAGLDESTMNVQDIGYAQVAALSEGQIDTAICYINNEPIQLERAGHAIDIIHVADYANLVSNGLVTNETTIAENPELIEGLLRAFLHGLQDTIDDPDDAFEIAKKYIDGLGTDAEIEATQREVLAASIELWQSDTIGESDPVAWQTTLDALHQMDLLSADIPVDEVYTNRFVDAVKNQE